MQNTLCHNRWDNNTIKGADAIISLELVIVIGKKGKRINEGKITISIDNRKVYNGVERTIRKAS